MHKRFKLKLFCMILGIFTATSVESASYVEEVKKGPFLPSPKQEQPLIPNQLGQVLQDSKNVIKAPFSWRKEEVAAASLIVVGTIGLMNFDKRISQSLTQQNSQTIHRLLEITDKFGYENYALPALLGTYAIGEIFHNLKARKVAILSMESFLFAGCGASIGKYLLHRQRPRSKNASSFRYDGPSFRQHHVSFPSGHTACAFAMAAVIAREFREESITTSIIAYSLAALTGLARIERKDHWASDVFFGACLGVSVGSLVAKLHEEGSMNRDWRLGLSTGQEGLQLALQHLF